MTAFLTTPASSLSLITAAIPDWINTFKSSGVSLSQSQQGKIIFISPSEYKIIFFFVGIWFISGTDINQSQNIYKGVSDLCFRKQGTRTEFGGYEERFKQNLENFEILMRKMSATCKYADEFHYGLLVVEY